MSKLSLRKSLRAIAKSNFGVISKKLFLAAVLFSGLSQTAKADETKNYQDFHIACDPAVNQNAKLNCSFNNQLVESELIETTQIAQGSRGRRRKSKVEGYYAGFSLGAIFPSGGLNSSDVAGLEDLSDIDYDTGFAGSVFGGIKFSKNISAELEFLLGFGSGGTDDFNDDFQSTIDNLAQGNASGSVEVDSDYTLFALYASPRFDLPISDKFNVFVSPGIGIAQTNVNVETESDLSFSNEANDPNIDLLNQQSNALNLDEDESTTGISFKIKAGAEYSISNSINLFGQIGYVTLPVSDDTDFDDLNSFLTQAGLTFNF